MGKADSRILEASHQTSRCELTALTSSVQVVVELNLDLLSCSPRRDQ